MMENAEEIFHFLEDFSKRKPKTIPQELNEYLAHVARTGDPVYQWSLVKSLFKEKLLNVITDFYETTPSIEIPPYPNVDPFNYDIMKNSLLERLDSFTSAPFTVQRICELLTFPRKQYNRVDKFMRAIEKNILVVSTREPGIQRLPEENGEINEPIVNGSDNNSEYNVDVEMEDMSWKVNNAQQHNSEPQPSSSDTHISVVDIEARLKAKEETPMDTQEKATAEYESVTPPELNVTDDASDSKPSETKPEEDSKPASIDENKAESPTEAAPAEEPKTDVEMAATIPAVTTTLIIPEIKIDDAEMTEQKLIQQAKSAKDSETSESTTPDKPIPEDPQPIDENSSDSKDDAETKISEVLTSSEESSSSSDNTDGSSSSPKTDEGHIDTAEESNLSDSNTEPVADPKITEDLLPDPESKPAEPAKIESDNYSISDVKSELPQPKVDPPVVQDTEEEKKETEKIIEEKIEENKEQSEVTVTTVEKDSTT